MKFLLEKSFRYRTAADSRKPGYLKRRFDAIRRLQRIKARKAAPCVTTLPLRKTSHG